MYEGEDERAIYRVRDGGLWRNCEMRVAVGAPSGERDVLEWQPIADPKKPALPIPFTAGEFAAFTLAGRGTMVIERFEDEDDEDALSDLELAKLGLYGDEAREVLREANRLRLEASRRFRRNVAKPEEPPLLQLDDEGTKNAVAWLLNGAEPAPAGDAAVPLATIATEPAAAGPASVPLRALRPLTTRMIADAFNGINQVSAAQWLVWLGDLKHHGWLIPARAEKRPAPNSATWWPLKLAELLQKRGAEFDALNRCFLNAPALKPWLPAWQDARRERNAFGA
jgi:hypothetical protein